MTIYSATFTEIFVHIWSFFWKIYKKAKVGELFIETQHSPVSQKNCTILFLQ